MRRALLRRAVADAAPPRRPPPPPLLPPPLRPPPLRSLPLAAASAAPPVLRRVWARGTCPPLPIASAAWAQRRGIASAVADDDDDELVYMEPAKTLLERCYDVWEGMTYYLAPWSWVTGLMEMVMSVGVQPWMAVLGVSLFLRVAVTPLDVFVQRSMLRQSFYTNEIADYEKQKKWIDRQDDLTAAELERHREELKKRKISLETRGGFDMRSKWLQIGVIIPLLIANFAARRIAYSHVDASGKWPGSGGLWFPDISQPDPYCILPVVTFAGFALLMDARSGGTQAGSGQGSSAYVLQKYGGRVMMVVVLYFVQDMQVAIVLALFGQMIGTAATTLLTRSADFKKWFDWPEVVAVPRSNAPELAKAPSRWQKWLRGNVTSDGTSNTLGGGLGNIAHAPTGQIRSAGAFVRKKSARRSAHPLKVGKDE